MIFNRRIIYKSNILGILWVFSLPTQNDPGFPWAALALWVSARLFAPPPPASWKLITISHLASRNCRLHVHKKDAQPVKEVCMSCARSCWSKTHVLKRYLISWLYVYKVRFKEIDSRLEFPAKAVPLSQFQIILLRSHSMPKSKQDYKKKQVVSNVFLHFWRVTSPSKLISWWQSLEAPGSPVLQDFAVDPLLPQETQTQEALEDPFRGVRANKPGRPANTMTWCTAKSSPPPVNPRFSYLLPTMKDS